MAKITHITIGMRRRYKHPFYDYESFEIEGGLTVEVEPGETVAEAREKSFPILREQMIATYKEFKPVRKEQPK